MIRINLLGQASGPAAPRERVAAGPKAPSQGGGYLLAILILGGALGFIAWRTLSAQQQISKLDQDIQYFTQEKARLQAVIAQVNEYEAKVKRLEEKENLIERLKRERTGPVHMLDELSAQLPDFIWLTGMSQSPGSINVEGVAASYVSIADYIRKLEDTAYFQNVELVDARQEKEYTKFQLRSQVVTPGGEAGAAGGATPTPGSK
jgi:type IV pilus assembly protein PilN